MIHFLEDLVRASQVRALAPPTTTMCSLHDVLTSKWMEAAVVGYSSSYIVGPFGTWGTSWYQYMPKFLKPVYWKLKDWKRRLSPPVYPEVIHDDDEEWGDE